LIKAHENAGFICEEIEVPVSVRTLDSCLDEFNETMTFRSIDFISIDVEGGELEVLEGFNIAFWKPTLFVIENNDEPHVKAVKEYLEPFGYKLDQRLEVNDFYIRV
jgi:hypothetical protein